MVKFDVHAARVDHGERVGALLSRRTVFAGLLGVIAVYYLFLLSNGTFKLFAPEMLDRVFDNMLVHLLHGEFTVDRSMRSITKFYPKRKNLLVFRHISGAATTGGNAVHRCCAVELARAFLLDGSGHLCCPAIADAADCP